MHDTPQVKAGTGDQDRPLTRVVQAMAAESSNPCWLLFLIFYRELVQKMGSRIMCLAKKGTVGRPRMFRIWEDRPI